LIFTSYGYHQTKVANLILCTMDLVDIIFPFAKCLKYMDYSVVCDYVFGLFMLAWVATRHVIYPLICYSLWADMPKVTNFGCYRGTNGNITGPFPPPDRIGHLLKPFRWPDGVVCFNEQIQWSFLSALLSLQVLMLMWFYMILRVAAKVLRGEAADDVRSDDEGEAELEDADEDLMEMNFPPPPPYEEEVGVESINLKGRTSNASRNGQLPISNVSRTRVSYRKSTSSSSGVSLPGHSDRKELLGRIGCDKPV